MSRPDKLALVMPVYNEEESLHSLFAEWLPVLESLQIDFHFLVMNDGSKDQSLRILQELAPSIPQLVIFSRENRGHGQSCMELYREAMKFAPGYIFQLDSDGQCDPAYFSELWNLRQPTKSVFAY